MLFVCVKVVITIHLGVCQTIKPNTENRSGRTLENKVRGRHVQNYKRM